MNGGEMDIIIIFLKILIEIACFICICILCSSSRKNPLDNHIIGDLSNYFNDISNNTMNITKDNIYNNNINKELINISSNIIYKNITYEKFKKIKQC